MISFIHVVEAQSFVLAAQRLHISNSAVSKQIKLLESDIGQTLLQRNTRHLSLTELGKQFYVYCKQLEEKMQSANNFIDFIQKKPQGNLKILSSVFFSEIFINPYLLEFKSRYPLISIDLEINDHHPTAGQGHFDIMAGFSQNSKISEALKCRKLFNTQLLLCAAPSYLKQHGSPQNPDDLHKYTFILNAIAKPMNEISFTDGTNVVIDTPDFIANNTTTLKALCGQGAGILQITKACVQEELNDGSLVEVLSAYPQLERDVYLFYQSQEYESLKVRCFIDYVLEKFQLASHPVEAVEI